MLEKGAWYLRPGFCGVGSKLFYTGGHDESPQGGKGCPVLWVVLSSVEAACGRMRDGRAATGRERRMLGREPFRACR